MIKERRAFVTCSTKYATLHGVAPASTSSLHFQPALPCNNVAKEIIEDDDDSVHCVSPKPDTAVSRVAERQQQMPTEKNICMYQKLLFETSASSPLSNSCKKHD